VGAAGPKRGGDRTHAGSAKVYSNSQRNAALCTSSVDSSSYQQKFHSSHPPPQACGGVGGLVQSSGGILWIATRRRCPRRTFWVLMSLGARKHVCSEICGVLHSSMPIVIESVSLEKFLSWLDAQASLVLLSRQHVSLCKFGKILKRKILTSRISPSPHPHPYPPLFYNIKKESEGGGWGLGGSGKKNLMTLKTRKN